MATPNTPLVIKKQTQGAFQDYLTYCYTSFLNQDGLQTKLERLDKEYQREVDDTLEHQRARQANKYGDYRRKQNLTVPIIMPAVESAVTYQTSVFLSSHPIFGVAAEPAFVDEATQLETILENQSVQGRWVRQLIMALRDGFKYNLMAAEVTWDIITVPAFDTVVGSKDAEYKEITWAGNRITRIDPYNFIFDHRVSPAELHTEGEAAGYIRYMGRVAIKDFINRLPNKIIANIATALQAPLPGKYYLPSINTEKNIQSRSAGFSWSSWLANSPTNQGAKIAYRDVYEVVTLYARIIPADFGLVVPAASTPQIFKLIYVNNILIYAERQTNAHAMLPIIAAQPNEDGLNFQTKSLEENVLPIQQLTSSLVASVIESRRRAVSDRTIYDPSRISEAQMNNPNPSAKIPVRPAAYGKPVGEAVYPFPFRDDQSGILLQETQTFMNMANQITGQNPARQGQFVKGNKTMREFNTVMSNANGRDQVQSFILEYQFFTPLKEILRYNILQYQGAEVLVNKESGKAVKIDPVRLRKAVLDFKLTDGLLPAEKVLNLDTLTVAMQSVATSPQLAAGYNIAPLFSYLIKTQGGNITAFEKSPEQVAYEQALEQWRAVAMEAAKSGAQMPPQPTPDQFGYVPAQQGAPSTQPAAPRVSNITNNITNNEQQ